MSERDCGLKSAEREEKRVVGRFHEWVMEGWTRERQGFATLGKMRMRLGKVWSDALVVVNWRLSNLALLRMKWLVEELPGYFS